MSGREWVAVASVRGFLVLAAVYLVAYAAGAGWAAGAGP